MADLSNQSMRVNLTATMCKTKVATAVLIDSGAAGIFIDETFAQKEGIPLYDLSFPLPVYNVDRTPNQRGHIQKYTWMNLEVGEQTVPTRFLATSLGKETMILGLPTIAIRL